MPSSEGFTGLFLRRLTDVREGENWTLDSNATSGTYVAAVGERGLPDTQIIFRAGVVTVTRPLSESAPQAAGPAPTNYLPEGLMNLVIAEVARTSAKARFCFVANSEAIVGTELRFTPVTMTAEGDGKVRLRMSFLEGSAEQVYQVDAKGEVFRIEDKTTGAVTRLIDLHSLARHFPEVLDVQRKVESGWGEGNDERGTGEKTPPRSGDFLEAPLPSSRFTGWRFSSRMPSARWMSVSSSGSVRC